MPTRATASWLKSRAARTAPQHSDYVWIIDPLDGTTNFIHGFPTYSECRSRWRSKGQVQQAVVYDPTRNDLFYASKGRGAFLNDKRLARFQALSARRMPDQHRLSVPQGRQLQALPANARSAMMPLLRRRASAGFGSAGPVLRRRGLRCDGFFETGLSAVGHRRRLAAGHRSGRLDRQLQLAKPTSSTSARWWPATRRSTGSWCRCWRRSRT